MARGNWQRRVESAESRRVEQRDRKARQKEETSKKSDYQKYVRHLFSLIDDHHNDKSCDSRKNVIVLLHLWLDKIPFSASKNSSSRISLEQKQHGENKKNNNASNSKKACHPRSNADFTKQNNSNNDIQYCRQHFFHAQCSANATITANVTHSPCTRKLSSCMHHLYHADPSLVECVSLRGSGYNNSGCISSTTALFSELKLSFEAAAVRTNSSNGDDSRKLVNPAMSALFHKCLEFNPQQPFFSDMAICEGHLDSCSEKEEGQMSCSPSAYIQRYLAEEQFSVTNIVYVVMDGKFWYDRYRGGVILSPSSILLDINDNTQKTNNCENSANASKEVSDRKANIPSNLLLFIFVFLPDQYVMTLSMVCKAYAREIASNKNLWSFLLQRRGWPTSSVSVGRTNSTNNLDGREQYECNHHRNSYYSHVMALTLLQTLAQNVTSLVIGSGKGVNQSCNYFCNLSTAKKYNFLNFRSTNGAPSIDDKCAALKLLDNFNYDRGRVSKNDTITAIGAFSRDGTIRAFELTPFGKKSNNNSPVNPRGAVRQIACVRATPLVKNSALVAMDMDDKFIACLCHVPSGSSAIHYSKNRHTVLLSLIHIEDFWCNDTVGGESIQLKHPDQLHISSKTSLIFNLEAAIFKSIQQQREEAVILDKKQCRATISVSPSIVACGKGNFIVHIEMLASYNNDYNEEEGHQSDIRHYLAIYSADAEEIIALHEITSGIITDTAMPSPPYGDNLNSDELSCWKVMACTDNSTRTANNHRSRSHASYVYAFQQQAPFNLILCRVLVESHKAYLDIVSIVNCDPQYIGSPVSSQDVLWTCSYVFADMMPSSRMLAMVKNLVGFNGGKTLFKSVISFHNPSNALTNEGGSYSTLAKSVDFENYRVDSIHELRDHHLLIIGQMCSGENGEDYVESSLIEELMEVQNTLHTSQRRNMRLYDHRKGQLIYFGSIFYVPTGCEICRVPLDALLRDHSVFPTDDTTFPRLILAASNRDPCIVAIPLGLGVIMIRIGEVDLTDDRNADDVENVNKIKSKKKKKIVTTPNGKKDGFARGMSLH